MGVVRVIGVCFACRLILYRSVGLQRQEDPSVCAYWGEEVVGPTTIPSTSCYKCPKTTRSMLQRAYEQQSTLRN